MRCKMHYTDLSSINGVCASCLRQRLFFLIAAQSQSHQSENQPVFPRSVSPYITRRKSDNSTASINNSDRNHHHSVPAQRFFNTPQVGPTVTGYNPIKKKQRSFISLSLLSNLFRFKNKKADFDLDSDSDPRVSNSVTNSCAGNRKKQPFCYHESSTVSGVIRKQYCSDRGMSPVRYSDYGGVEDEFCNGSSGYESCVSRKQTPWWTPVHPSVRRGGAVGGGNGKNVSPLNFCLSPLVRASPCRHWNQKGISLAVDGCEIIAPVKPHISNTKSCANRSRKLADFGRFNNNS